jgi:hypothetical protein
MKVLHSDLLPLLRAASRAPWGPGREIEADIHTLYQDLLRAESRLGRAEEKPEDLETARRIGHELRTKLAIFQFQQSRRAQAAGVA